MSLPYLDSESFLASESLEQTAWLNCERIGIHSHVDDWSLEPHLHEAKTQIFLFLSGPVYGQIEGQDYTFVAPSLVWVPPMTRHGFLYPSAMEGYVLTLSMADLPKDIAECRDSLIWRRQFQHITGDSQNSWFDRIKPMFTRIEQEFNGPPCTPARDLMLNALIQMLYALLHRQFVSPSHTLLPLPDRYRDLIGRFQNLLEHNFHLHLEVNDYAAQLSVTPEHLTRVAQTVTGQSASRMIQSRVLHEARRLLVFGDLSIADIGARLGFSSPSYFTRYFTKGCGHSPRNYRQQMRP